MLDGAHPLTKHDIQPLDAQSSLRAGRPLGVSCGLFQAKVTGLGTNNSLVCQLGVAQ